MVMISQPVNTPSWFLISVVLTVSYMRFWLLASLSSLLGTTCCGMSIAFTSTLLPQIHQYVDEEMGSWIASIEILSQLIGILMGSLLIRKYGRRPFLILLNVPWVIGWLCLSVAATFWIFLLGSFIIGTIAGFYGFLATVYLVEIPTSNFRGFFAALNSVGFYFGIWLENFFGTIFAWRTALQLTALLPLFSFIFAFHSPESPNWLVLNQHPNEAKQNLSWLRNFAQNDEEVIELLEDSTKNVKTNDRTITKQILSKEFVHSFFVVSLMMITNVVACCESLTMYTVDMIRAMSKDVDAEWVTVLYSASGFVSSLISCTIIERFPRRLLFFSSSLGVLIALFMIVIILAFNLPAVLLTLCLCAYHLIGNLGMLVIPWLLAGEIFPDATRDLGSGLTDVLFSMVAFVSIKMNPFLMETLGMKMLFFISACLLSVCILILYFVMPETRGYTLKQIERRLRRH